MTIKQTLSTSTIGNTWIKIRDIAVIVALITGALANPASPILLPVLAIKILSYVAYISSAIAGFAQTDTSKLLKKIK